MRTNTMILMILALPLILAPSIIKAQEPVTPPGAHFSSTVRLGRFELIANPFAYQSPFRLDRTCGDVEMLVPNQSEVWGWRSLPVPEKTPCILDVRDHYQLFGSDKDHIYLMNTDTKTTWQLDISRLVWMEM